MQHVEEAGVHSGDSACVLPAPSLTAATAAEIHATARTLAAELGVVGLLNVQFAVADGDLYVLEVNPRASRTVPFASKATGVNLVEAACRLALGREAPGARPAAASASPRRSASRRRCSRSRASPAPTRCSAPRCARPAR